MALDMKNLNPGNSSKAAPSQASYETADLAATVEGAGYFNNAADGLASAGSILVHADTGGTPTVILYGFTNTGSVVTLNTVNKEVLV